MTTDGYILTAAHVIFDWTKRQKSSYSIRVDQTNQRTAYPLDFSIWGLDLAHDVALVKAVTGRPPGVIPFRIGRDYSQGRNVQLLTFNKNNFPPVVKSGRILEPSNSGNTLDYLDSFLTSIPGQRGDSGGLIVSTDGSLLGLASYIRPPMNLLIFL